MIRDVKPLNVSPLIKSARWSLLFLGYIYGVRRKHSLEIFDSKAAIERKRFYEERLRNLAVLNRKQTNEDIRTVIWAFEGTEIPEEYQD